MLCAPRVIRKTRSREGGGVRSVEWKRWRRSCEGLRKKKITVQRCGNELWVAKSAGRTKVPEYHLQQNNRWRAFYPRFQTFSTWQLPNSTPPGPITARRKHLAILSIRIFFPPLFSVRSVASLVFPTAVPDLTAFSQPRQLQLDCDLMKLLVCACMFLSVPMTPMG